MQPYYAEPNEPAILELADIIQEAAGFDDDDALVLSWSQAERVAAAVLAHIALNLRDEGQGG